MKRLLVTFGVFVLCILLTLGIIGLSVRSSKVQTAVIALVTDQLQTALDADVHIDKVDIRLLSHLIISGVYLSDQQRDTLLYIDKLDIKFNPLAIDDGRLDFPSVKVNSPYICYCQDSLGSNIDFILRACASKDTTSSFPFEINLKNILIRDARLRYRHTLSGTDVTLSDFEADFALPVISKDTLCAQLNSLSLTAKMAGIDAEVHGAFHGGLDTIWADNFELVYRNTTMIKGDIEVAHPLDKDHLMLNADLQDLYFNQHLLSDLLSDILRHPVILPEAISRLGNVHYRGLIAGHLRQLSLHGAFLTRLGDISTEGHLTADRDFKDLQFTGDIRTKRFELGRMVNAESVGRITADINARAHICDSMPLEAETTARIASLFLKNYQYTNISLDGSVADSVINTEFAIADPNLSLRLKGNMDCSAHEPEANFSLHLKHLKLRELGLTTSDNFMDQDLACRSYLYCSVGNKEGQAVDCINGRLLIDSIHWFNYGGEYHLDPILVNSESTEKDDKLILKSQFITAGITGRWWWSTMGQTIKRFAHEIFPTMVPPTPLGDREKNDLDFYAYFSNIDRFLMACGYDQLKLPGAQMIKGYIHESADSYDIQTMIPTINKGNQSYSNLTISLNNHYGQAELSTQVNEHVLCKDSTKMKVGEVKIFLHALARNDSILTTYTFGDITADHADADIRVNTHLGRYAQKPLVDIHILPSEFYISDTLWTISESHIRYNAHDTILKVDNFAINTTEQSIRADGVGSPHFNDSIMVMLKDIDLGYFMQYTGVSDALEIGGLVSGWVNLHGLFHSPVFEANVSMPNAHLNRTNMGDLTATATIDRATKHILISGDLTENRRTVAHVDGLVRPKEPYWELNIHTDSANIAMVNHWTTGIVDQLEGRAFGDIHIFGRKMKTWVTLKAMAKDASLVVPYTGVRYHLSDSIILDTTYISFPNVRIWDDEGHTGVVNGRLDHTLFKDMKYHIGINLNDMMALNLPYSSQSLFYGKAYATGHVDINGSDNLTQIDISAQTRGKTDFHLSVATAANATDNGFISFVNHKEEELIRPVAPTIKRKGRLLMNMNLDVTRDAKVNLLLASHSADGISCRGEGSLRLTMNNQNTHLFGTYSVQTGTFSFTLGNLVRRDFSIAEGSTIVWNGAPAEPTLNVAARYHLTASLKDLFGSESGSISTSRTSVPVNCVLNLSNSLSSPIIKFAIELPQSDESVSSQVYSIINTEEMLMRQVVYLLVFNRFFTPEYLRTSNSAQGLMETYSLLSSTVTGQINAWLGRLTDVFSMGFNFRSEGASQQDAQEYEAQFKLTPVDRLSINGNFGYRYNDLSNRPFFGDVDIEYGITQNGKFRIKGFTHTVDKYSLKQANTVQGIGFIFSHDFNWGDYRRKQQLKKQQAEKDSISVEQK